MYSDASLLPSQCGDEACTCCRHPTAAIATARRAHPGHRSSYPSGATSALSPSAAALVGARQAWAHSRPPIAPFLAGTTRARRSCTASSSRSTASSSPAASQTSGWTPPVSGPPAAGPAPAQPGRDPRPLARCLGAPPPHCPWLPLAAAACVAMPARLRLWPRCHSAPAIHLASLPAGHAPSCCDHQRGPAPICRLPLLLQMWLRRESCGAGPRRPTTRVSQVALDRNVWPFSRVAGCMASPASGTPAARPSHTLCQGNRAGSAPAPVAGWHPRRFQAPVSASCDWQPRPPAPPQATCSPSTAPAWASSCCTSWRPTCRSQTSSWTPTRVGRPGRPDPQQRPPLPPAPRAACPALGAALLRAASVRREGAGGARAGCPRAAAGRVGREQASRRAWWEAAHCLAGLQCTAFDAPLAPLGPSAVAHPYTLDFADAAADSTMFAGLRKVRLGLAASRAHILCVRAFVG